MRRSHSSGPTARPGRTGGRTSAAVLNEVEQRRLRVREAIEADDARRSLVQAASKVLHEQKGRERHASNPLSGDLLMAIERSAVDGQLREYEAGQQRNAATRRREEARNAIVVTARTASNDDVTALREQRRLIEAEERRLRALFELERAKLVRKDDMAKARRAMSNRREAQKLDRRRLLQELQAARDDSEKSVLKIALGIAPPPDGIIEDLRTTAAPILAAHGSILAAGPEGIASAIAAPRALGGSTLDESLYHAELGVSPDGSPDSLAYGAYSYSYGAEGAGSGDYAASAGAGDGYDQMQALPFATPAGLTRRPLDLQELVDR